MDSFSDDTRTNDNLKTLTKIKQNILDCAKNIKSNDETFGISTLPDVSEKLSALMSNYVDTYQRLEAAQRTYLNLAKEVAADVAAANANDDADREFLNLNDFKTLYDQTFQQENETVTTETEAHLDLQSIIEQPQPRQEDEEVVVEAPTGQIPKDPITKKNIKVAVKNVVCNHIYDQGSFEAYFTQKEKAKGKCQCPVAGCQNRNIKRKDIVIDEDTNKLIESIMKKNDL